MESAKGSLTMLGLNTSTPTVFWNGIKVQNITAVRTDWDADEQRVKLKVTSMDEALYQELITGGIIVKRVN